MSGSIEALHIYDSQNTSILSQIYHARPLSAAHLLPLFLAHPVPRPSLIYLPNTSPPTLVFSLTHCQQLFLLTTSRDLEPLLALEFLHRVIDIFEDFLGGPLTAAKIEANYDVCAQLLNEMCDGGSVATTEGNALREVVEVEGFLNKLLGSMSLPGKPGFSQPTQGAQMQAISSLSSQLNPTTPALPWRRSNVKHTSNELYVDLIESLSITHAPSGRPLSAFANGTIAFTSKISGIPDLLLTLTSPSGKHNLDSVMELPVFHPCVRLAKWKERAGELSFIPPDGRFVLAGYEVDLLPFTSGKLPNNTANLKIPVSVEVKTSLGQMGSEFEVRLQLSKINAPNSNSSSSISSLSSMASGFGGSAAGRGGRGRPGPARIGSGMTSSAEKGPGIEDLVISVPISGEVRTLSDIRASRGEVVFNPGVVTAGGTNVLEWRIPARETGPGIATLRATVVPTKQDDDDEDETDANGFSFEDSKSYNYNEDLGNDAQEGNDRQEIGNGNGRAVELEKMTEKRTTRNKLLMPRSANISFSIKGWLASGIRVESLVVDKAKSRGLGDGVRPYKGVKYLTVSRNGVEVRC